jgi:hypothetical protein
MKIIEAVEDTKVPLKSGDLAALPGGNRSRLRYSPKPSKQPFFYLDEDYIYFADKTVLAVYDTTTHKETSTIELPCPGLAIATRDEEGYTYYGTWDYSPLPALYNKGAKPCLARLKPDDTLDEAWTTDLTDLTGGRYGANFNYVRDGWGLLDVLNQEELSDLDFTAATIPAEAVTEVWDKKHWSVWFVDLKNKQAHPLDSLGEDLHSASWELNRIGDRVFIELPRPDETTVYYELDKTGNATLWDHVKDGSGTWRQIR